MKGLLLKEWYMMKKYCRAYLLITVIFLAVSCVSDNNMFFALYPCLLCGMIPINLLSFDEHSGWIRYSGALPYSKAQIVSAKYLTELFTLFPVLAATGIVQTVRMALNDTFQLGNLLVALLATFMLTAISVSVCLPFIFRFGTEKGRIVYFVMVGMFFGGVAVASRLFAEKPVLKMDTNTLIICLVLVGCGLYALSWALSIAFYKRREV